MQLLVNTQQVSPNLKIHLDLLYRRNRISLIPPLQSFIGVSEHDVWHDFGVEAHAVLGELTRLLEHLSLLLDDLLTITG